MKYLPRQNSSSFENKNSNQEPICCYTNWNHCNGCFLTFLSQVTTEKTLVSFWRIPSHLWLQQSLFQRYGWLLVSDKEGKCAYILSSRQLITTYHHYLLRSLNPVHILLDKCLFSLFEGSQLEKKSRF
jgi:hypothetical protein